MLALYVSALVLGGSLLLLSLFAGGDGAADGPEVEGLEGQADVDGDADGGALDAVLGWLPVTSLRFWIFFAAFFGVTGTLFTTTGAAPAWLSAVVSAGVGYVAGLAMVKTMRLLASRESSSSVGLGDYVGETATVLVPVGPGRVGKVRLDIKGRTIDLLAETEDPFLLEAREKVVIYRVSSGGQVLVTRSERLLES